MTFGLHFCASMGYQSSSQVITNSSLQCVRVGSVQFLKHVQHSTQWMIALHCTLSHDAVRSVNVHENRSKHSVDRQPFRCAAAYFTVYVLDQAFTSRHWSAAKVLRKRPVLQLLMCFFVAQEAFLLEDFQHKAALSVPDTTHIEDMHDVILGNRYGASTQELL